MALTLHIANICQAQCVDVVENDCLTVGIAADYPPFVYYKDNQMHGIDIDIAKEIARSLGKQLKIKELPFYVLFESLDSGIVDIIMSGIATNHKHSALECSDSYCSGHIVLAHLNQDITNQFKLNYLNGKRVGVQHGTVPYDVIHKMDNNKYRMEITALENALDIVSMLEQGLLDFAFVDEIFAKYIISNTNPNIRIIYLNNQDIGAEYTKIQYSIGIAKNLCINNEIKLTLKRLKKNKIIAQIHKKWHLEKA